MAMMRKSLLRFSADSAVIRIARAGSVLAAASLLAACAGEIPQKMAKRGFAPSEYGVSASPVVARAGDDVPKGGGRYMVGDPYRVAGRTYVPKDNPRYSAVGLASWYGEDFHGRMTANGEVYDMAALTAAHPTMPLPSYARVTNLANNRSVVVRVNDRGPFSHDRIIDVSASVASLLDFKRAGVAQVRVDYVGPAQMDGLDQAMLMASYRGPGSRIRDDVQLASASPAKAPRLVLASATPQPKRRPRDSFDVFSEPADGEPQVLLPPAATAYEDPLAPLILRSGLSSSYAPADRFSKAAEAANDVGSRSVVQIGLFSSIENAERAGELFRSYGEVSTPDVPHGGQNLRAVRVVVDVRSVTAQSVLATAKAAGFGDAYILAE
jgi:rare lipoprotein A